MTATVVVFGFGNPSRGDDAIGPLLIERLDAHRARCGQPCEVDTVVDFQPQIEHAADLRGRSLAVFVDAGTGTREPFSLARLEPSARFASSSHALDPAALLHVYRQAFGAEPPPAYLLCVRGYGFGLGQPIDPRCDANGHAAWDALCALLDAHLTSVGQFGHVDRVDGASDPAHPIPLTVRCSPWAPRGPRAATDASRPCSVATTPASRRNHR